MKNRNKEEEKTRGIWCGALWTVLRSEDKALDHTQRQRVQYQFDKAQGWCFSFSLFTFVFAVCCCSFDLSLAPRTNNVCRHTRVQPATCTIYRFTFTHTNTQFGCVPYICSNDNDMTTRPTHDLITKSRIGGRRRRGAANFSFDNRNGTIIVCVSCASIGQSGAIDVPMRCAIKIKMSGRLCCRWVSLSLQETNNVFLLFFLYIFGYARRLAHNDHRHHHRIIVIDTQ